MWKNFPSIIIELDIAFIKVSTVLMVKDKPRIITRNARNWFWLVNNKVKLDEMSSASKTLGKPNATKIIVDHIMKINSNV